MLRPGKNIRNGLYVLTAIAVIGGAGWLKYKNLEPERDPDSLCSASENGQTIILVDKTDLWSDAQANRLEDHIWWLIAHVMRQEERLHIFTFNDVFQPGFPPTFSFCKPPSGDAANNITQSKAYYNREYKKQFVQPLKSVLENIKKAEEKDCSPIVEVLFDILTRSEIMNHGGPTRIVMISDLAQNSSLYSFYQTTKCRRRPAGVDPRYDTKDIERFIRDRAYAFKDRQISVIVFQVFPQKNPPYISQAVKEKWPDFFQFFGIVPDWQLL